MSENRSEIKSEVVMDAGAGTRSVVVEKEFAHSPEKVWRALFERLTRDGELTVHALTARAGVSQPAVSKHLTVLKRARLVNQRREGREMHYSAQPKALAPLVDWMAFYGVFWREKFSRLEDVLERMEP